MRDRFSSGCVCVCVCQNKAASDSPSGGSMTPQMGPNSERTKAQPGNCIGLFSVGESAGFRGDSLTYFTFARAYSASFARSKMPQGEG